MSVVKNSGELEGNIAAISKRLFVYRRDAMCAFVMTSSHKIAMSSSALKREWRPDLAGLGTEDAVVVELNVSVIVVSTTLEVSEERCIKLVRMNAETGSVKALALSNGSQFVVHGDRRVDGVIIDAFIFLPA